MTSDPASPQGSYANDARCRSLAPGYLLLLLSTFVADVAQRFTVVPDCVVFRFAPNGSATAQEEAAAKKQARSLRVACVASVSWHLRSVLSLNPYPLSTMKHPETARTYRISYV